VLPDGRTKVLERVRRAVRLGQDTFVKGRLSNETMAAAIAVLNDYARILETYRVGQVHAVATSAVREAGNADAFVDRVYMSCGLDVEVIEPTEESRLTVSAVRQALERGGGLDAGEALIADVGGGNCLLTVLHNGGIVASESYRLGSVRLQESLSTADEPPARAATLIRQHIGGLLGVIADSLHLAKMKAFLAVGGDARFAADRIGKATRSAHLHTIGLKAFDRLVGRCEGRSAEELARKYKLAHAEAETLVPALLVCQGLVHATAARKLLVSDVSMRDGLLLDVARSVTGQEDEELARSILQSARTIGEKYHCDAGHAEQVAELSVRLFDELRAEHGLSPRRRLLLRVAGLLHEVGGFVSSRAHHKHSYYLLSQAEVFGLRREEQELVALTARYHRRALPKPSHVEYMSLPRDKRMVVSKLAALLRVADALDRGHARQARELRFERAPNELILRVPGATDLALERRALAEKADLFEEIFGMRVRLEEA
jgi:exopolyphosphatase/guanosine-5'-triphosphate,3'-diphosphate pyrophosphatase